MSSSKPLNIGVLGAAAIAQRSVLPALASMPDAFRIAGIASRSLDKAEQTAAPYACKAHGSYAALLEDESVQAVYIPLPNGLHHEWVMRALRAGKHVLCEKSLGCTAQETHEMTDVAERHDLALVENFQFRFHSQFRELRRLMGLEKGDRGCIGELRTLRCSFGFPPFAEPDNIRYQKELGGGALLDAGAYTIKIATLLLGRGLQVGAAAMVEDPERGVDLHGSGCLVEPQRGITAHIAFGFDHFYQCGVEVWGAEGRLRTNRLFTAKADVEPVFEIETADRGLETRVLAPDDHFANMLRHFRRACDPEQVGIRAEETAQNRLQATLLEAFRLKAAGR